MPPKASDAKKSAPNGNAKSNSSKPAKAAPATTSAAKEAAVADADPSSTAGKPDQAVYNKEQDALKVEIDAVTKKLNALKEKINSTSKDGPAAERRNELKRELDEIKGKQGNIKANREKILERVKALQDSATAKAKSLQASKTKSQFRTVEDVDARIRELDKQVESGKLTLAGEKKALAEISSSKRARKTVEGFQAEQDAIDKERADANELRKTLDEPEFKAMSERFDIIKKELDELRAQGDEAYANRNKLFDERKAIQTQLDDLWTKKKESSRLHRESNDRYYQKIAADRQRRQERYAAERAANELAKKKENAARIREEAEAPAYQAEIEDCQTLISTLNAKIGGGAAADEEPALNLGGTKTDIAGVPKLDVRTVDAPEGLVARKKKGEDESNYFVASGGKGKKGTRGGASKPAAVAASASSFNLPFATLTALLTLSIPPPASLADIPRTVEDLKTKKAWFEANQARKTKENIEKAEAEIKKLDAQSAATNGSNTNGEVPPEPTHTPAQSGAVSSEPVAPKAVDEKLEEVKETVDEP